VPDSIRSSPSVVSKGLPERVDRRQAKRIILEILRQVTATKPTGSGLARESIAFVFWFAHLYYAKRNPGYLTNWPLIRTSWGVEIRDASALLGELVEEELVRAEPVERGPFFVTVYQPTGKESESELSPAAVEAIRQAATEYPLFSHHVSAWPIPFSRAWCATPVGEEMDVYLDLIPEEEYEERRRQMEGLKEGLRDLFS
jgi:hypothetical protein